LTTVLDDFQPAPQPVNLVYAANRFLPIKVRAFLDFATPIRLVSAARASAGSSGHAGAPVESFDRPLPNKSI
jgi:hypothetical protein